MQAKLILILFILIAVSCNTSQQSVVETINVDSNKVIKPLAKEHLEKYPKESVSENLKYEMVHMGRYPDLLDLYQKSNFEPFFTTRDRIIQGLSVIRNSKYHGFEPEEYGFSVLDSLYTLYDKEYHNYTLATCLELKLMKGIYMFSCDLHNGKLNPNDYHFSWNFYRSNDSIINAVLNKFLKQGDIGEIEFFLEPKNLIYKELKKAIKYHYDKEKSSYSGIKYPGHISKKGDSSNHVKKIKECLSIKGYYSGTVDMMFNDSLKIALEKFQIIHGLNPDGVPGKKTYAFLNWSDERYINALKVNLERLRWLSDTILNEGILVNIPAALMQVNSDTGIIFQSKLVVGTYKNQTPVYHSEVDYLVFNPCWTVPHSIAVKKMLPKLKSDSNYLKNRNMFIGLNGIEQETTGIDFSMYNKNNFPYKIYQRNGSGNALGNVKFMFHNPYSIYLHDTPSKSLFSKDLRAYSHGCVRVQKAMEFADILLYKLNSQSRSKQYYLRKGYPEIVNLKNRIPISLVYLTSFYNQNTGHVYYYTDIYSKDLKVLVDLEKIKN